MMMHLTLLLLYGEKTPFIKKEQTRLTKVVIMKLYPQKTVSLTLFSHLRIYVSIKYTNDNKSIDKCFFFSYQPNPVLPLVVGMP